MADEAAFDLTQFTVDYDEAIVEEFPEPNDIESLAAKKVIERWSTSAGVDGISRGRQGKYRALLELVPLALAVLARTEDTDSVLLEHIMRILRYERYLTPSVSRYLAGRKDAGLLTYAFDKLLRSNAYLNGWQSWWLQDCIARRPEFGMGVGRARRVKWLRSARDAAERSSVLRAYASLSLARHKEATVREALAAYDRTSVSVRPILVAALALLHPTGNVRKAIIQDDVVYGWIFDWAQANA